MRPKSASSFRGPGAVLLRADKRPPVPAEWLIDAARAALPEMVAERQVFTALGQSAPALDAEIRAVTELLEAGPLTWEQIDEQIAIRRQAVTS